MSGELTNEDHARMTLAETCSHCGANVTTGGEVSPLRCPMCGSKLHGQEREWHRPAKAGCPTCGRGLAPRGELVHFPGCPDAGTERELSKRSHPSQAPRPAPQPVSEEAEPRCPAHPSEPLFTCIECADKRVGARL